MTETSLVITADIPQYMLRVYFKGGIQQSWFVLEADSVKFKNAMDSFQNYLSNAGAPKFYKVDPANPVTGAGSVIFNWADVSAVDFYHK